MNIKPGESILDLGCGGGRDTIEAAKRTGPTGISWGMDITDAMLGKAAAEAESQGMDNVRFVKGDIEYLPFADDSFHAVMSNCVINRARDKKRVYSEIYRILKDGAGL